MRAFLVGTALLAAQFIPLVPVLASEPLVALTDQDVPRGFLAEGAARRLEPTTRGVGIPFVVPDSMKPDVIYGIDTSHHSFAKGVSIDWQKLTGHGIGFVYMKATEGLAFYDGTFRPTWEAIGAVSGHPLRGGYHFLRASDDPVAQADLLVRVLQEQAKYEVGKDLPPVVDVEWDCRRNASGRPIYKNGRCEHDNWSDLTPSEIIGRVEAFNARIKAKLDVDAVVYTATSWWNERSLSSAPEAKNFLATNPIWIADYSRKAQKNSKPNMPAGKTWTIWQFTDNGKVTEVCEPSNPKSNCTDTNAVFLSKEEFARVMGVGQ